MNLIPGSTMESGKSVKGMWAFWSERHYPNGEPLPKENHRFHAAKVLERRGRYIKTTHWKELPLGSVWLLPGDVPVDDHWPRYERGSFKDLTKDEAREVLTGLGVENLGETK